MKSLSRQRTEAIVMRNQWMSMARSAKKYGHHRCDVMTCVREARRWSLILVYIGRS